MGKKLERALAHVGRAFEDKGLGRERAERIGVAMTGKVARLKAPAVLDDHDTRGLDGVQP